MGIDSPHWFFCFQPPLQFRSLDGLALATMKDPFSILLLGSKKKAMEIAQTADLNVRNEHGQTLMFAAAGRPSMKGSAEVLCRMLQERGLAVDALDIYQQTPLFAVAREGNETCADYLIALGANPNHADLRGETPLCVAFRNSQMELVMRLLDEPICYSSFFFAFFSVFLQLLSLFCKQASTQGKQASKHARKASKQARKQARKERIKETSKPAKPGSK